VVVRPVRCAGCALSRTAPLKDSIDSAT
jgi:hypothetical protein